MALVWLGFRSWQYAVVAMIPNAVPIYMVMGLLGWLGLKMNMGAVDDRRRLDGHVRR